MPMIYGENSFKKYRKRILKDSSRRFCYPELKDAMNSYRVRKLRQAQHAKLALERAKTGRAQAEALIAAQSFSTGEVVCEGGDYIKELAWGDC
jgi:tRNA U54 and U55 pseudouridine synthase Pus10